MNTWNTITSQHRPHTQSGETLCFEKCKGGYLSTNAAYRLKVAGKTEQVSTPTPTQCSPINCVKQGTKILCGDQELLCPTDLYEDDIWYPTSGVLQKSNGVKVLDGTTNRLRTWDTDVEPNTLGCFVFWWGSLDGMHAYNQQYATHFSFTNQMSAKSVDHAAFGLNNGGGATYSFAFPSECGITTVTQANQWLAAQAAAGNPVTVVYKLATPLIQAVSPQTFYTRKGTVTVESEAVSGGLAPHLQATMLISVH